MCTIFFSYQPGSARPLLLAANRDEFFARKTAYAGHWANHDIVGGLDLEAHGSWLALNNNGRFAALTNYRLLTDESFAHSRGELVNRFVEGGQSCQDYAQQLLQTSKQYAPYNLLFASNINRADAELYYFSNQQNSIRKLAAGTYGLSNHLLDSDWPKVKNGRQAFKALITAHSDDEAYFDLLRNDTLAADNELPDTGVGAEFEKALSALFINLPHYGTRCSTLVKVSASHWQLEERSYQPEQNNAQFEGAF